MPNGREKEPRSIPMLVPFSAFLSESHSIELDFYEAIGEIEIIISQNGDVIYSLTHNKKEFMTLETDYPLAEFN